MADLGVQITGPLEEFDRRLSRPEPVLLLVGKLLASDAQDAFDRQGLDAARPWPPRYPQQNPPKVNIAGAIMDLSKGPNISSHRFQDRPAVIDTGYLRSMLAPDSAVHMAGTHIVEVGTTVPYASVHQFGGETSIPLTSTIKENLATWEKRERGRTERATLKMKPYTYGKGKKKTGLGLKPGVGRGTASWWIDGVMSHLSPIYDLETWDQTVLERPFLGITNETADRSVRMVADWLAGGPGKGPWTIRRTA